ncbi:MAG: hypothetical protein ACOC93_02760, partial [Planctomycetota bacterium]
MRNVIFWIGLIAVSVSVFAGCGGEEDGAQQGGLTVAVVPKGTMHSFWTPVRAGAEQAAEEMDARMIWKGP